MKRLIFQVMKLGRSWLLGVYLIGMEGVVVCLGPVFLRYQRDGTITGQTRPTVRGKGFFLDHSDGAWTSLSLSVAIQHGFCHDQLDLRCLVGNNALRPFLLPLLSWSESSPWTYRLGVDRSWPFRRAFAVAVRDAPRRVEPLRPRQLDRCGA